jgi:hypothetical protein
MLHYRPPPGRMKKSIVRPHFDEFQTEPQAGSLAHKSFLNQAASWKTARRMVAKIQFHFGELFPRVGFIVSSLETDTAWR